jgi:8-oxo-dGTP pyrophosphatase MutT (NUDIX family)
MPLENYELEGIDDWASLVWVEVLPNPIPKGEDGFKKNHIQIGCILVTDPKYGSDAKWKMPGGHRKKDETPLETALRELEGETGIKIGPQDLEYKGKELGWRGDHWRCLFVASITEADRNWMNALHRENEGEIPKFFTVEEFYELVRRDQFFKGHYDLLVNAAVILPLGREKVSA